MGLIANEKLGSDPFCKRAKVFTGTNPPVSCIIDGIQLSSNCTLGKGRITVENKNLAKAEFTSEQLPLAVDHPLMRAMVKQSFPEHKKLWIETSPPEERSGPSQIPTEFDVEVDGEPYEVKVIPSGGFIAASAGGPAASSKPKDIEGAVKTNMQGTILGIKVKKGDKVKKGSIIATIEAMKMEQELKSEVDGEVKDIFIKEGDSVASGDAVSYTHLTLPTN